MAPRRLFIAAAIAALVTFGLLPRADAVASVKVVLAKTLKQPTAFATRPGEASNVYIGQKPGQVRRLKVATSGAVTLDSIVVLNLSDRISTTNERGLHGIAFNPAGTKFYASYTNPSGATRLAEYPYANGRANKSKERVLFELPHPTTHHYAGQIAFGPDGLLYMAIGDGATGGAPAQNLGSLHGKILRISPAPSGGKKYTIPASNPFVGQAGVRGEIWHYGLRNPWRWSFDRSTGEQWVSDVGERTLEEVNHLAAGVGGANFGWNKREGTQPYKGGEKPPGAVDPVYEYNHDLGDCSITGGYVYRGTKIPALTGQYVFTDYCRGVIRSLHSDNTVDNLGVTITSPVSFGEDAQGELWILSIKGGVYRLLPA